MPRFQRILVSIDRLDRDLRAILARVSMIAERVGAQELHLLRVEESFSPEVEEEDSSEPLTGEGLQALLEPVLPEAERRHAVYQVVQGAPALDTARYALEHDIDLIVIGRDPVGREDDEAVILARRVARKATCSVLVMPENAVLDAGPILVPARDSECSANALEVACEIARNLQTGVVCLNVFRVRSPKAGHPMETHQARLAQVAADECQRLYRRIDAGGVPLETRCEADLYGRPVPRILDVIGEISPRLVVIGARGRTGAAGVLLGKVTEQLIQHSPVPVLAVKRKGECLGVLQALLQL